MESWRLRALLLALMSGLFLTGQQYNVPFVPRASGVTPIWQVAFNTDGSNSTYVDSNPCTGDCDTCTEHGADSNFGVGEDCEYTAGSGEPEGTGTMRYTADRPSPFTVFSSTFSNKTELWGKFHVKVDTTGGSDTNHHLILPADAGASNGWSIGFSDSGKITGTCNSTTGTQSGVLLSDDTWHEIYWHAEAASTGDLDIWIDDFTGGADVTCDGATSADVWNSLQMRDIDNQGEADWIRFYDEDPEA